MFLLIAASTFILSCEKSPSGTESAQADSDTDYREINADIGRSDLMITVANRDVFRYDECFLTVNDDYYTKTFWVKPDDGEKVRFVG